MKSPTFLLFCCLGFLCSCSKSDSSGSSTASAGAKPAASGDEDKGTDSDSKAGTFWELPDKADLKVVTAPWPAKAGPATLKAEIDPNDDGQKFSGTLLFRITAEEQSPNPWQAMPKVREGADKTIYFEAPISLATSCYIQFQVREPNIAGDNKNELYLTDWKVDVK